MPPTRDEQAAGHATVTQDALAGAIAALGDTATGAPLPAEPSRTLSQPRFAPPDTPDDLGRLGKYRIVKELGRGGMGAVYLAFDDRLRRKVALKVMLPRAAANPTAKERFLREARAAARIGSDHVVAIYEAEEIDGIPYIALQYLQGTPLDRHLKASGGPVPVPQAIRIARDTAGGLADAHRLGLVHRDIKPGNLWLEGPSGRVKILDFGLAKPVVSADAGEMSSSSVVQVPGGDTGTELTGTDGVVGTPAYMAPEQGSGGTVDARADLFSLGCVLYRLVTGRLPFDAPNTVALLMAVAAKTPTPVEELNPAVPPALADLIRRLMAKKPTDRPKSARAVADELALMLAPTGSHEALALFVPPPLSADTDPAGAFADLTEPGSATDASIVQPAKRGRANRGWLIGAGVAALVVLLMAAFIVAKLAGWGGPAPEAKIPDDTLRPKGTVQAADPDRAAAEWVLRVGGNVVVVTGNEQKPIRAVADLPNAPFHLRGFVFDDPAKVDDAGAAHFAGCQHLAGLDLRGTSVGDAGLRHFAGCKQLDSIRLPAGVTDAGLAHFKDCNLLVNLVLTGQGIVGPGLAHFAGSKRLGHLNLAGTGVTDNALAPFAACAELRLLLLSRTPVTNAALAHFKGCRKLAELHLSDTGIDDGAFQHLAEFEGLTRLTVTRTKVTAGGVEQWKKKRPNCELESSFGDYKPAIGPDRAAAVYLFSIGGKVVVDIKPSVALSAVGDLPKEPFKLTGVNLTDSKDATDDGLAVLAGCSRVRGLIVQGDALTPAGLKFLTGFKELESLSLFGPASSDDTLARLRDCTTLGSLSADGPNVSDAGLAHLKGCVAFGNVALTNSRVTVAGLRHLSTSGRLLQFLDLRGTKMGAKDLTEVRKLFPTARITHDGGVLPAPTPDRAAAEWVLEVGGSVVVTDDHKPIRAAADLPAGEFRIRAFALDDPAKLDDAGAAHFADCQHLVAVDLRGTRVGDDGLAHFRGAKRLNSLCVSERTTDAGLAHFKGCDDIRSLILTGKGVTDAGLAHFKDCKALGHLNLSGTGVTDGGLVAFAACRDLKYLGLNRTGVTNAALDHFKGCLKLEHIHLTEAAIDDGAFARLAGFESLTRLTVSRTKVTAGGLDQFRKQCPKCQIESSFDAPKK